MQGLWVATLYVSERTAEKVEGAQGLRIADVCDAVVCVSGLRFGWDDDPDRGLRAIVQARIGAADVLVVLYPASDPMGDAYHLGSAYPV